MPVYLTYNDISVLGARIPAQGGVPLSVHGAEDARAFTILAGRTVVGTSAGTNPVICDLSGVTPGRLALTIRVEGGPGDGSHVKPTTVVAPSKPGPSNTGPRRARGELTPHPGGNLSTPGKVYEGMLFTGQVIITGDDSEFYDCAFTYASVKSERTVNVSATGVLFDHVEIDGTGRTATTSDHIGIGYSGWTARFCNIHGTSDGVRMASGTVLEDSWIHGLMRRGNYHPDCVQMTGGSGQRIRRNFLEANNPATGDLGNAAIQLGGETSPLSDVIIEGNWFSGGNYTINVGRGTIDYGSLIFRGNRYAKPWRYGPFAARAAVVPVNDVLDTTGEPIPLYRW